MKLEDLFLIIEDRKRTMPKNSYVTSLLLQGEDLILQKVGEEAIEVILAAKGKNKKRVIEEIADLWFHSLILLSTLCIKPSEIFSELELRHRKKKKNMI